MVEGEELSKSEEKLDPQRNPKIERVWYEVDFELDEDPIP